MAPHEVRDDPVGRTQAEHGRKSFVQVMRGSRYRRVHAALIAFALAGAVAALIRIDPGGRAQAARQGAGSPIGERPAVTTPAPSSGKAKASKPAARSNLYTPFEGGHRSSGGYRAPVRRFSDLFPRQSEATVNPAIPATNYWALLIGINDYYGGTRDNIGSYQDARDLRQYLFDLGWHYDHVVLLANRDATASMILQAIDWLASKTDGNSVVVFNYSGHEEPEYYGGRRHIMLHAADNRFIADTIVASRLGRVAADKMWINLAVCRAGGFNDPGLVKTGRVVTFSSPESELSYEDPQVHHSVMGWFIIMEAMVQGQADANHDDVITVEEAFKYASPRIQTRTHGAQDPFMKDALSGSFVLIPPQAAAQSSSDQSSEPDNGDCGLLGCAATPARMSSY
jgi:caspase domain-containing protein